MSQRLSRRKALLAILATATVACTPAQPAATPKTDAKPTDPPKPAASPAAAASPSPSPSPSPAASPAAMASPAAASPVAAAKPAALPPKPAGFPSGPIQMWVGFPAGGSTDVGARILAAAMDPILGQPVTVVNKPGGSGQSMWTELMRQPPNGSILGLSNVPQLQTTIIDPERQAVFTLESFTPIANQVLDPGSIFVPTNSRFQTLADVIDAARQNPGRISAGDTGIASDDHLQTLELGKLAGVEFRVVHFEGGTPQTTAVLGGQIDTAINNVGEFTSKVKSGDGRLLAVADDKRSVFVPDVPTFTELGYPIISYSGRGYIGPAGMNADLVNYLAAVIQAAMDTPDVRMRMDEVGLAQRFLGPAEFKVFLQEQMDRAKDLFTLVEEERKQG